jgi:hypothetical protein
MKQTVYLSDFRDAFRSANRNENFSYEGLEALFECLEEIDENMELDVVALCCEFTEYEDMQEFCTNYGDEYETFDDIQQRTLLIPVGDDGRFIIQDF